MLSLTSLLLAGLGAAATTTTTTTAGRAPATHHDVACGAEPPSPALLAAYREADAMGAGLGRRSSPSFAAEESAPLVIETYAHIMASSKDKLLSQEALQRQMGVINRSYRSVNVSFVLAGTQRTVDATWAVGNDRLNMLWDNNRGDGRALNLYFIDRFAAPAGIRATGSPPDGLAREAAAFRLDGVVVAPVVPGAPGHGPAFEGKLAVHAIGHWLGLRHTGSDACDGDGCPLGLDSCPGRPGLDPIRNFMSTTDDSCKHEFTPGQGRRIRQMWNRFRAEPKALPEPVLAPIEPVGAGGKLPYYGWSKTPLAAMTLCTEDRHGKFRETREELCGTFLFCYFGAWRHQFVRDTKWQRCLEARAGPDLEPESPEPGPVEVGDAAGLEPMTPPAGVASRRRVRRELRRMNDLAGLSWAKAVDGSWQG